MLVNTYGTHGIIRTVRKIDGPVLVTGAAGLVGGIVAAGLRDSLDLRLTDLRPGPGIVAGDLTDPAFAADVVAGTGAIVHLAANADPEVPWPRCAARTPTRWSRSSTPPAGTRRRQWSSPARCTPSAATWTPAAPASARTCRRTHAARTGRRRCSARRWPACTPTGVYHGTSANSAGTSDIDGTRTELGYEPADDAADHAATVPEDSHVDARARISPAYGGLPMRSTRFPSRR